MATMQFSEGGKSPPTVFHRKKQLLNNIVDGMARTRPWAVYAEIPRSSTSYEAGYRRVTYGALANGINGVAWSLKEMLGESHSHQTLVYIGPNDLGYVMMILGAVKAGYKLLLVSPRNTASDHISLFKATACRTLLTPQGPQSPILKGILEKHPIQVYASPSLEDLLANAYPHYPFPKRFEEARHEPLMVVHTSGTTAVPKPIVYSHDFAASYVQLGQLEPPRGFEAQVSLCQSNRFFVTLPFFHAGNLYATLFDAIANQTIVITPLPGAMPSAQLIFDGLHHVKADALLLAPQFLEQIAKSPEITEFVTRNVDTVAYGGGDVSQWAGDALASGTRLFNFMGSTETGSYPLLRPSDRYPSEDWKYIHIHPAAGVEFRPSSNGLFEAVLVKSPVFEDEQPVFKLFPHLFEYPTKDLFAPHPSKPDLWTHRGRVDDTITFKSGHMCDPITMEQSVSQHPEVRAVLMAGTGRSQPALLIEPEDNPSASPTTEQEMTKRIWPIVEEANHKYQTDARVARSHILCTDPGLPMRRAGKGTIQRAATLELYKDALDALYLGEGDAMLGNELVLPNFASKAQR